MGWFFGLDSFASLVANLFNAIVSPAMEEVTECLNLICLSIEFYR